MGGVKSKTTFEHKNDISRRERQQASLGRNPGDNRFTRDNRHVEDKGVFNPNKKRVK